MLRNPEPTTPPKPQSIGVTADGGQSTWREVTNEPANAMDPRVLTPCSIQGRGMAVVQDGQPTTTNQ